MTMNERERQIRMAYAYPHLRKQARWGTGSQYIPDDSVALGFSGPAKDIDAEAVGAALEAAYNDIRLVSHYHFKKVASVLKRTTSDGRPDQSRAAIRLAYQDVFLNLADSSMRFFKNLPRGRR